MTEKFVSKFPEPSPYESEVLAIMAEECAEVTQRATKALRFGLEDVQQGQEFTNSERISHEIGDLLEIIDVARLAGILNPAAIMAGRVNKRQQLAKYMQNQPE